MDFYVYAIKSKKDKRVYVGLSHDVEERLHYHNSGAVFSTKGFVPWILIYKEKVGSLKFAREREKYFKTGSGKEFLKNIVLDP